MKRNMSNTDRIVRVLLAALFAYLYFSGMVGGALGIVLIVLGGVFLLTGLVAYCPLYAPFNFSTHKGYTLHGYKLRFLKELKAQGE